MTLNTSSAANAVVTLLDGLSGMASAQIGAPASIGPQVTSWVALGSRENLKKTTGTVQHLVHLFVCFCYRVDGAESTVETALMGLVDAFEAALDADLTLGGAVESLTYNSLSADEPEYQLRAGKEYREYPMVLICKQMGTYAVNP